MPARAANGLAAEGGADEPRVPDGEAGPGDEAGPSAGGEPGASGREPARSGSGSAAAASDGGSATAIVEPGERAAEPPPSMDEVAADIPSSVAAAPVGDPGAGRPVGDAPAAGRYLAPPPPLLVQVASSILERGGGPVDRLRLEVEPAELGTIEITLIADGPRKARAILEVERPETLDLLQREQRSLERILSASGLELEAGGLELGLRRDGDGRREAFEPPPAGDGARPGSPVETTRPARIVDLRLLDLVV